MTKSTLSVAVATGLLAFASTAYAEPSAPIVAIAPHVEYPTVRVSYADLNLATSAGLERLDARVRGAARQVCGVRPDRIGLDEDLMRRSCYRESLGRARDDIKLVAAQVRNGTAVASLPPIQVSRR